MKNKIKVVSRMIPADLETPVGIYLKIRDLYPQSALLESSDYHTSQNSVSYIGVCPIGSFTVADGRIGLSYPCSLPIEMAFGPDVDVVAELRKYVESFEISGDTDPGVNGLFGYTAYDAVRYFEKVAVTRKEERFAKVPDMKYILYRYVVKVNHYKNQLTVYEHLAPGESESIDELISVINNNNIACYPF